MNSERVLIGSRFRAFIYKIKLDFAKLMLNLRYKLILKLIGAMPVIVNCTIYDDIMEYNFGKTRTYKPCICTKNTVKNFEQMINAEIARRKVYVGDGLEYVKKDSACFKTQRRGNSFALSIGG